MRSLTATVLVLAMTALPEATFALRFNFNAPAGTDPLAVQGFIEAGERWSALLSDDITVNIDIGFSQIPDTISGATVLGSTGSELFEALPGGPAPTFTALKEALEADATSRHDAVAVGNLPPGSFLQALTNDRSGAQVLDNGTSGNNTFFSINTANAKAIGLLPADAPGADAAISFNSDVFFDFDPSDGITPGAIDFVGVATHEIGHALGFTSGVDIVDTFTGQGPSADVDLNGFLAGDGSLEPFALFTPFDLFRRSDESLALGPEVLDLTTDPGSFFSIDGGASPLELETGSFNGSGQQAAHFLDGQGFGILDPTAAPGELLQISPSDLLVFDAIGFDLIEQLDPTVAGDYNGDGVVTAADFTVWRDSLGLTGANLAADGDANGVVDIQDYLIFTNAFTGVGAQLATVAITPAPEPNAALLALAGLFAVNVAGVRPRSAWQHAEHGGE